MSEMNEKELEKLLSSLPKPAPLTEIEQKRLEKVVRNTVAEVYGDRKAKNQKVNYFTFSNIVKIAAAFALIFSAFGVYSISQNNQGKSEIASGTTKPSASNSTSQNSSNNSSNQPLGNNSQNSSKSGTNSISGNGTNSSEQFSSGKDNSIKFVYQTDLDYAQDFSAATNKVITSKVPILVGSVTQSIRNCMNNQGISDTTYAVDRAYFDGEKAQIFYLNSSKTNLLVVDSSCKLIKKIG